MHSAREIPADNLVQEETVVGRAFPVRLGRLHGEHVVTGNIRVANKCAAAGVADDPAREFVCAKIDSIPDRASDSRAKVIL